MHFPSPLSLAWVLPILVFVLTPRGRFLPPSNTQLDRCPCWASCTYSPFWKLLLCCIYNIIPPPVPEKKWKGIQWILGDRWMDGCIKWMDAWMVRWMERWRHRWMDEITKSKNLMCENKDVPLDLSFMIYHRKILFIFSLIPMKWLSKSPVIKSGTSPWRYYYGAKVGISNINSMENMS